MQVNLRQLVNPVISADFLCFWVYRQGYVDAVLKKEAEFLPALLDNLNSNNNNNDNNKHLDSATKSLEALNMELATNSLEALKV